VDDHRGGDRVASVRVGRFLTRAEADVARSMLEASGLEAVVLGDDGGGVHPAATYGHGGMALGVHPDDVDEARELLADVAAPLDRSELGAPTWRSRTGLVVALLLVLLLAYQATETLRFGLTP
jgi:hypothetical protein